MWLFFQAENGPKVSSTVRLEGPRFPSVPDHNRGQAIGGPQHGSSGVHPGGRPEEVHQRQGEHQLSLLQRGSFFNFFFVDVPFWG